MFRYKYFSINLGFSLIKVGFGKFHIAFFIWCTLQTVSCLIYLGFRIWATVVHKRSVESLKHGHHGALNKIMLAAFAITQIGVIYGTVQLVLYYDLPPASSITILMEMVSS